MVKQDLADNPYQSPGELHASAETETGSKESEDGRPTSKGDVSGFGLGYLAWALPIAAWIPLIAMIVIAFRAVSVALRNVVRSESLTAMSWGIGVSMLTHSMIFLSVSYFGQIVVLLQLAFALTASAALASTAKAPSPRVVAARSSARRPASARVIGGQAPRPVSPRRTQERPA